VNVETEGDLLLEGCHWLTGMVDVTRLTGPNVALLVVDTSLYHTIMDGLAIKTCFRSDVPQSIKLSRHCCFKGFMDTAPL